MEEFLNILEENIIILDDNFNFKFCNDKFLNEVDINTEEVEKIILNTSNKEELIRHFKNNNTYSGILKSYYKDKYIKLHSKVVKHINENKVIYYVVVDKIGKSKFEVYKGKLIDNIENVINSEQYYINILEDLKYNLESDLPIEDALGSVDVLDFIDGLLSEFYKIELTQTSFSLFLNLCIDFAGSLDEDGNLIMLEGAWTKTIGWEYEELININMLDIIHPDFRNDFKEKLKNNYDEIIFVENKVRCKDGQYKWLRWNMKHLKGIGVTALTVKDISLEKEEAKRIIELKKEIEAENLKHQFFANLSHEFKTPLNILLGIVQLLEKKIENKKIYSDNGVNIDSYVKLIKQNSYRLLRLSNNLIDMSKIDAGYYKLNLSNNNIVSIVEDISLSVVEYINEKGLNLVFDTDCEELVVACNPDNIERILLNLLSNAIKNTNDGGNIYVNLTNDDDSVSISVIDDGCGIPKDKLSKIFNRFEQVDKCLSRNYEGSGIGLSLVESLVNMHNGKINAKSNLGEGSEFTFTIPKKLVNNDINKNDCVLRENRIERCNIEFSDIYK